jgi:thiol:disulfide interchange protein DsbD
MIVYGRSRVMGGFGWLGVLALAALMTTFLTPPALAQMGPPVPAKVTAAFEKNSAQAGSTATLLISIDVPPGFHAQSNKPIGDGMIATEVVFDPAKQGPLTFGQPVYPPGEIAVLPVVGQVSEYKGKVTIKVPVAIAAGATGEAAVKGSVTLQICDEQGTCYPPTDEAFAAKLTITPGAGGATPTAPPSNPSNPTTAPATQQSGTGGSTGGGIAAPAAPTERVELFGWSIALDSLAVVCAIGFVAGVIFNVMPCVLPVLPLKALGFYEASHHNRAKTFGFGLTFSAGLIAVFAALAIFVLVSKSLVGEQFSWGQWFSYPSVVAVITLVLGALGFAMLGGWSFKLPTRVYMLNFRHDTYSGNFLWGAFTAVLSTPCTAPMFPPVLAWALGQPIVSGVLAVLSVGVGMASPYLVLSGFPELARRFPRTGPFAELVKQMMGFLMLGTAAFFLGMLLVKGPNHWWFVLAVAVWASLFLIVRTTQLSKTSGALVWATGFATLITGGTLLGVLYMTESLDRPAAIATNTATGVPTSHGIWAEYTPENFETARQSGNIVLVKFTADWCLNCKYIERTVFTDDRALKALRDANVILLKADLTRRGNPGWTLLEHLGGNGIPFTAVYPAHGETPKTLASIYTTDGLLETLKQVGTATASRE